MVLAMSTSQGASGEGTRRSGRRAQDSGDERQAHVVGERDAGATGHDEPSRRLGVVPEQPPDHHEG